MAEVATFCRICEPSCGLIAEVEQGELQRLKPDKAHPVTQGFACHKGLGFGRIHADPARVDVPQRRTDTGFVDCDWEAALSDIGQRLKALVDTHGPDSVGLYFGNPTAFSATAPAALLGFMKALGLRRQFNSGTQDCSNKFAGSEAVFGTSTLHPIPDLEHTDFALIFGENPKVSHMSFVSQADPMAAFRRLRERGGRVCFVNPRRIESAVGEEVLQVQPDTDLYLLAALLHEIDAAGLFEDDVIAAHGRNIEGLRDFIAPYSAQAVAAVCGIPAAEIQQLALDFAKAPSACVHMSTGLNMGRQGTLCYWLLQMLSFCTGNLDRRGGNLYAPGFFPATRSGRMDLSSSPFAQTVHGELRAIRGALPGNLLADFILEDPQPIRALIVVAGNPLLSIAGEERLRQAFAGLDLLVSVDLYRNASGELADYVLPACDMLERADINLCGLGMQAQPFVQYSPAVVPARGARREEWWIFAELLARMGHGSGADAAVVEGRLQHMLSASGLSLAELQQSPSGTVKLPSPEPGRFYQEWIQTADHRVDCCPALFAEALLQAAEIFAQECALPPGSLRLINLRTPYMHNSWLHNDPALKRPRQQDNPLHMHPTDAERLGLGEGAVVKVHNPHGALHCKLHIDPSLRPGVVAMSHGWGQSRTPGMPVAQRYPGSNVNVLLPQGRGSFEKLSNQAHMTGIPVEVRPAAA